MTDKIQNRLTALKTKHAELDALIEQESSYPRPDDTKIHEYKKQKLKERVTELLFFSLFL